MRCLLFSLMLCLLAAQIATADDAFAPEVRIEAGGTPIDVEGFRGAAPWVGDFNGDGTDDLLVGQDLPGRLRIYQNVGTNENPQFEDFEWFRINGEIVELPTEGPFRPQLVDLNGDGQLDIVATSETGMIFWYQRIADTEFTEAVVLKLGDGQVLNVGSFAGCHVVDWDDDGDHDLIVAGQPTPDSDTSQISFVENQGSRESAAFAAPRPFQIDGTDIEGARRETFPRVVDWNHDGKKDLLLGLRDGSILLYEDCDLHTLRLAGGRQLVGRHPPPRREPPQDAPTRGWAGGFCVTDWNQDGRLDLLMGDAQRETVQPDTARLSEELNEAREEAALLLSEYRRLRGLSHRLTPESQAKGKEFLKQARSQTGTSLQQLRENIASLEKAMQPQRKSHGYVWLLESLD